MHNLLQAAIKRIIGDKILLGLVIVGMLGIFVGAFCSGDDSADKKKAVPQPQQEVVQQAIPSAPAAQIAPTAAPLDAKLATDFVKWWMSNAMDYQAATAHASHSEAFRWMTRDALATFQQNYWTPQVEQGVTSGQIVAAFQPVSIQAEAMNPDGSIVVGVTGTLVIQSNGQPFTNQLSTDFLVRRDKDGLRIAGLYNRQVAAAAAPAGAPTSF